MELPEGMTKEEMRRRQFVWSPTDLILIKKGTKPLVNKEDKAKVDEGDKVKPKKTSRAKV